jgi:hypothetical protein
MLQPPLKLYSAGAVSFVQCSVLYRLLTCIRPLRTFRRLADWKSRRPGFGEMNILRLKAHATPQQWLIGMARASIEVSGAGCYCTGAPLTSASHPE